MLNRKLALIVGMIVVGASLVLFNLPRYLEVTEVKEKIGNALDDLKAAYREYLDNERALDMIRKSMKSVSTFDDLKKYLPEGMRIIKKGDRIEIIGRISPENFNILVNFIMKTSNMAIYELHVKNPNDSPFALGEVEKSLEVDLVVVNPEVGG